MIIVRVVNLILENITWVKSIASVIIVGVVVYMWYRNDKTIKGESRPGGNKGYNYVIVGTIIKVEIIREICPRECLITVKTNDGKYIESKIVIPKKPFWIKGSRYMEDPNIGDEIKYTNEYVSDCQLKYDKKWFIEFTIYMLMMVICTIISFILIFIYEAHKQ